MESQDMRQLTLSVAQVEALRDVLQRALSDLSYEIADTDRKAFRDPLKERRERIREVMLLLGEPMIA